MIHHPNVIDIPTLSELRTKAKLTLLSSVSTTQDPLISELTSLLTEDYFLRNQGIPNTASKFLERARSSIASINKHAMNYQCKKMFKEHRVETWNDKLSQFSVQRKFLEVTELEAKNCVWKRILHGLPAGQLSFLLRAGSDTLPTPLNLRRWRIKVHSKCCLCENRFPTVHHILSNCPTALTQGRYTWRHDSALKILTSGLIRRSLPRQTKLFADLPTLRVVDNPPPLLFHLTSLIQVPDQIW